MNFALILFILVVVTGLAWLADKFIFIKQRRVRAATAMAQFDAHSDSVGDPSSAQRRAHLEAECLRQPLWLEYSAGFFPVIVAVFCLRSFVVEPFRIPSGSMMPTLLTGDFILVNKFTYGLRLPVLNKKIFDINNPQRGDVMVFRYPKDPSLDYIKRVIGLPGDTVAYEDKRLTINGKPVSYTPLPEYLDEERLAYSQQFLEQLGHTSHRILTDVARPMYIAGASDFPQREHCVYSPSGMRCTVPAGHYFMLGDNRDGSADSRYWGFVPEANIVGRAFFIWMNLSDIKRIGSFR